jgi:hypothetical protein
MGSSIRRERQIPLTNSEIRVVARTTLTPERTAFRIIFAPLLGRTLLLVRRVPSRSTAMRAGYAKTATSLSLKRSRSIVVFGAHGPQSTVVAPLKKSG